jgi:hypothetical protein
MNKHETVEVVERVYASWNQQLPSVKAKWDTVMNAWHQILANLNKQDVDNTVNKLILEDNNYMPRPGTIYKQTIRTTHNYNPPTPAEAWDQLRQAAQAAHNGTHTNITIHPTVRKTIDQLGGTNAYQLHTNGDRELFTTHYTRNIQNEENELFNQQPLTQ